VFLGAIWKLALASTRGEVWGGQESDVASVEEKSERRGEVGDGGGVAFEEGDGRGGQEEPILARQGSCVTAYRQGLN